MERRPAALDPPAHPAGLDGIAGAAGARLSFAPVNRETVLEVAELAIGAAMIAQGGAPGGDGGFEHVADGAGDRPERRVDEIPVVGGIDEDEIIRPGESAQKRREPPS